MNTIKAISRIQSKKKINLQGCLIGIDLIIMNRTIMKLGRKIKIFLLLFFTELICSLVIEEKIN